MSHDNDNARNFAAAAACGIAAVTPLISTWPTSATHTWLDDFSILGRLLYHVELADDVQQEAQLMLTTGSTRLAVSRGQQIWCHSTCNI